MAMALGPNRSIEAWVRPLYALNAAAERGGIVCTSSTAGQVEYRVVPTGAGVNPVGILVGDIESMNFDRHPEYLQRNVADIGSVVPIVRKGEVQTNLVVGTPTQGQVAYLHPTGYVGATRLTDGIDPAPIVGRFLAAKDANGFATLYVDL